MRHAGGRNEDARHAEFGAIADAVRGTGAAVGEQHKIARIVAAPDRDFAQGVGHVAVDHAANAGGCGFDAHAERLCDLLADCGRRAGEIEFHAATEEIVRVENAKDQVRVGDGGELTAAAVADRTRHGAGAVGSHPQETRLHAGMAPPPAPMARISMTGVLR